MNAAVALVPSGQSGATPKGTMSVEERMTYLESKVNNMQTTLDKYRSRFRDQKLFCKYVAEYLLHKFGFNIWLRLQMVKAAGEGLDDSDEESLYPKDLPSIFNVVVNKSTKERQPRSCKSPASPPPLKNANPLVSTSTGNNGILENTSGRAINATENSIPVLGSPSNVVVPANVSNLTGNAAGSSGHSGIPKSSSGMIVTPLNKMPLNGNMNSGAVNRGVTHSLESQRAQIQGSLKKRPSSSLPATDGNSSKVFLYSGNDSVNCTSKEKINVPAASTAFTGQLSQSKPVVESVRPDVKKVPDTTLNSSTVPLGTDSLGGIRVVGNVVELPEVDISGLSKETEDADTLYELDFEVPEVQDCSSYSTRPSTSPTTFGTRNKSNQVEIVHDDYNDPNIDIKYEDAFQDGSSTEPEPEISIIEPNPREVIYQVIAPPKIDERAAGRCRRSSPFDISWLYQMKKYQQDIMPYTTLIKRDEFRQWFEYLPSEKPEESRFRCRLCYKYMQTYGIPRSNWGPVESERGQLKRGENANRNVINTHGKKKSHLEIMKRLEMEGNPDVGFVDRFDKSMKKKLLESLEKFE